MGPLLLHTNRDRLMRLSAFTARQMLHCWEVSADGSAFEAHRLPEGRFISPAAGLSAFPRWRRSCGPDTHGAQAILSPSYFGSAQSCIRYLEDGAFAADVFS